MSLYNMLHGYDPAAPYALHMLGIEPDVIPRFRDVYFDWADTTETTPVIVILTRTGGGNREVFADENRRLTEIAGYISDRDDEFDVTFALFTYAVPTEFLPHARSILAQLGRPLTLRQKTDAAVEQVIREFPKRS